MRLLLLPNPGAKLVEREARLTTLAVRKRSRAKATIVAVSVGGEVA
jgi:hypothetical protein